MKAARQAVLGIAPSGVGTLAIAFLPTIPRLILLMPVYVFGVACCFRAGFGLADLLTRSPGKNLILGFVFSASFIAINLYVLVAASDYS